MQNNHFHFFPRTKSTASECLTILDSILNIGPVLTFEKIDVKWEDRFAKRNQRKLNIEQYRFCLSAISTKEELKTHSDIFGQIGIEFESNFVIRSGGFPVFYVPTPEHHSEEKVDYVGISLLYRLAESQELLEYIVENSLLESPDIDLENALGAIRALGHICYPTNRHFDSNNKVNYYNQREWRIIKDLSSSMIELSEMTLKNKKAFAIASMDGRPVRSYITRILLNKSTSNIEQNDVQLLLDEYQMKIPIELI